MENKSLYNNISIILVDTKTPSNIGATARCMMNMGLSDLILVHPPNDPYGEAGKLAAGADIILDRAKIFSTLVEATKNYGVIFGTSRHKGRLRKNVCTPRYAAEKIIPLLSRNKIAIVFGNEVNGLTGKNLALCHEIISIPSSDDFPSLNLSHAIMIVAYELFLASGAMQTSVCRELLARSEDTENFYQHLQRTLITIGFLERNRPERMMSTLRQIFSRSRPSQRDVAVLRGILASVDRIIGSAGRK